MQNIFLFIEDRTKYQRIALIYLQFSLSLSLSEIIHIFASRTFSSLLSLSRSLSITHPIAKSSWHWNCSSRLVRPHHHHHGQCVIRQDKMYSNNLFCQTISATVFSFENSLFSFQWICLKSLKLKLREKFILRQLQQLRKNDTKYKTVKLFCLFMGDWKIGTYFCIIINLILEPCYAEIIHWLVKNRQVIWNIRKIGN